MARLVSSPKPPPLTYLGTWRRSINKKLGRPATADVGTLAGMFVALRDAAGLALGSTPDSVSVSQPPIPGLAAHDLADALEHAGLRNWLTAERGQAGLYPRRLTEAHAVFAAHGQGLCADYRDLFECWEEEEQMALHTALLVGFTKGDLRAEIVRLRAPFEWSQGVVERFVDLEAGLNGMSNFQNEEAFCGHVRDRLTAVVRKAPAKLMKVMLAGESAADPRFLGALRNALGEGGYVVVGSEGGREGEVLVLGEGNDTVVEPTFASARGAAQYSRWRQEAPIGCRELERCNGERETIRAQTKHGSWELGSDRLELR